MSDLHVVASIPAKPGSEGLVRAALTTLMTASREEEGCVEYDLFESASAPGTFVTIEAWRSQADLEAHMRTPHIAATLGATADHLAGEIVIHPLAHVG